MTIAFSRTVLATTWSVVVGIALTAGMTGAQAMSAYRWKKRPLVGFASNGRNAALARQWAIVNASAGGFWVRDIVVVYVIGGVSAWHSAVDRGRALRLSDNLTGSTPGNSRLFSSARMAAAS